jgi:hypothetical protein
MPAPHRQISPAYAFDFTPPLSAASAARGRPTSVPALRSLFQF